MPNAKFWLIQFLTVAFVTVVLGSPVMAHGRGYKSYKGYGYKSNRGHRSYKTSYNYWKRKPLTPEQKDERFHKKMERNISYLERRIQKFENKIEKVSSLNQNNRRVKRILRTLKRVQAWKKRKLAWYEEKLDRHNDKYHNDDDGGDDDTGGVDPVAVARAKCTELFGAAADFNATSLTCTNLGTGEIVQL